jgi:hypothetical protein
MLDLPTCDDEMTASQTWRVTRVGIIGGALMTVLLLAIGAFLAAVGARTEDRLGGVAFALLAPVGFWLFALRPYVELTPVALVVQNPIRRWRLPLSDIRSVEGGYSGLQIEMKDGRQIGAWAVQRSNAAMWIGRSTRSDGVLRSIQQARAAMGA